VIESWLKDIREVANVIAKSCLTCNSCSVLSIQIGIDLEFRSVNENLRAHCRKNHLVKQVERCRIAFLDREN